MKTLWINHKNYPELLLFFNGWGMDRNAVKHLNFSKLDVCMLYDYHHKLFLPIDLNPYKIVYIVAWSFGAWVVSQIFPSLPAKIKKVIALNGTLRPISIDFGISPYVFKHTYKNWVVATREKFYLRMLGGAKAYNILQSSLPERSIEKQKQELGNLYTLIVNNTPKELPVDTAIIGERDLIFPPNRQADFWKNKTVILWQESPHYPFHLFSSWEEIIAL